MLAISIVTTPLVSCCLDRMNDFVSALCLDAVLDRALRAVKMMFVEAIRAAVC